MVSVPRYDLNDPFMAQMNQRDLALVRLLCSVFLPVPGGLNWCMSTQLSSLQDLRGLRGSSKLNIFSSSKCKMNGKLKNQFYMLFSSSLWGRGILWP